MQRVLVTLSPEFRTTGFHPNMALSVFPKLMNTMIVLVMDGGITASIKALTGYFAMHRYALIFHLFRTYFPPILDNVNGTPISPNSK